MDDDARAVAVGQHAGAGAEQEVDQPRQPEHQRHRGAFGGELGSQRREERGEGIRHAEDHRQRDEARADHAPAAARLVVAAGPFAARPNGFTRSRHGIPGGPAATRAAFTAPPS